MTQPRRAAVAVLATVFVLNLLGRGSGETYAVFMLPLEREFGWARSQLTSVYSAYLLVGGLMAPLVGLVFDRLGPRMVYTAGLLCLSTAFFLASLLGNGRQVLRTLIRVKARFAGEAQIATLRGGLKEKLSCAQTGVSRPTGT